MIKLPRLPLLPLDKANHVAYGNAAALLGYALARVLQLPPALGAAGMCLAWATAKELPDLATGQGTPEGADWLATVAGGAPVALVAWSEAA